MIFMMKYVYSISLCLCVNVCLNQYFAQVRRSAVALLSIQHTIIQKEAELAKLRASTNPRGKADEYFNNSYIYDVCISVVLAQQRQKVLTMPVTDVVVRSTTQTNTRIKQEVEEQLRAAKRLAEAEFMQSSMYASGGSEAGSETTEESLVKKVNI